MTKRTPRAPTSPRAAMRALTERLNAARWLSPDAGLDLLPGAEREWLDARHEEFRASLATLAAPFEVTGSMEVLRSAPDVAARWSAQWSDAVADAPNPPLLAALGAAEGSGAAVKITAVPAKLRSAVEAALADAVRRWGGALGPQQALQISAMRVVERQWAWVQRAGAEASPWAALLEVWMRGAWPVVLPDGGWLVFVPVWQDGRGVADPSHAVAPLTMVGRELPLHLATLESLGLGPPPRIVVLQGPVIRLFTEALPAALVRDPQRARAIGWRYRFTIAGEGVWSLDLASDPPSVREGSAVAADVTISISGADFEALMAAPESTAMRLFFAGKLKVVGNTMLAMNLAKILALV